MLRIFLRLAAALALAGACGATQVPRLSFEEVVQQSEQIIAGKVARSWTAWSPSHEFVWTHYEVEVDSVAKGRAARTVTVSEPGGVLDGRGMEVSGAVPYRIGEQVVLFLRRTPIGYNRTVGWQQGKYTVAPDGRVHAAAGEARLVDLRTPPRARAGVDGSTLAELQTRIASLVRKDAVSR